MSGDFSFLKPAHIQLLHELVDSLSSALDVPVSLTDSRMTGLARRSNTSFGYSRISPPIGLADVMKPSQTIDLTEVVSIPAVPQLGIHRTYALPVRSHSRTLAVLWLVDESDRLTSAHLDYATAATRSVIGALDTIHAADAGRQASSYGDLTSIQPWQVAGAIIETAQREAGFTHDNQFVATSTILTPLTSHAETLFSVEQILRSLAARLSSVLPGNRVVESIRGPMLIVIFAPRVNEDVQALKERITTLVTDHLYRADDRQSFSRWSLGFSSRARTVDRVAEAIKQAHTASRLAGRADGSTPVLEWAAIRHLRGILNLGDAELVEAFLEPTLEAFLGDPSMQDLVDTLRAYLEHAGHVPEVASSMFLHRATVYYRLRRVEDVLGVDLARGDDRLQLHLGIAAWDFLHGKLRLGATT